MLKDPHRYDTLLRVRQRQQDLAAEALAQARRQLARAERARQSVSELQRNTLTAAGALASKRLDAGEQRQYFEYVRYLGQVADGYGAEIQKCEQVCGERRAELEEAAKRRRIIERLRERLVEARRHAQFRAEQTFADEVAVNRAVRARKDEQR